jgi:hypothetical protein
MTWTWLTRCLGDHRCLNITGDHWSRAWTLIDLGHVTYLKAT